MISKGYLLSSGVIPNQKMFKDKKSKQEGQEQKIYLIQENLDPEILESPTIVIQVVQKIFHDLKSPNPSLINNKQIWLLLKILSKKNKTIAIKMKKIV